MRNVYKIPHHIYCVVWTSCAGGCQRGSIAIILPIGIETTFTLDSEVVGTMGWQPSQLSVHLHGPVDVLFKKSYCTAFLVTDFLLMQ